MRPVSRTRIGVLCALFIVGVLVIRYMDMRVQAASGGVGVLDVNFGNSHSGIRQTIAALGADGRAVYLKQFLVADFCYFLIYATFFSQLFRFLAARLDSQIPGRIAASRMSLLPWGAMTFDWLENLAIGILLAKYPGGLGIWYVVANIGTVTKFAFTYISIALLGLLLLAQFWRNRS